MMFPMTLTEASLNKLQKLQLQNPQSKFVIIITHHEISGKLIGKLFEESVLPALKTRLLMEAAPNIEVHGFGLDELQPGSILEIELFTIHNRLTTSHSLQTSNYLFSIREKNPYPFVTANEMVAI